MNGAEETVKKVQIGIVMLMCISQTLSPPALQASTDAEAFVAADHLNVRKIDSISAPVIGSVRGGEILSVLSERNGWAHIEFHGKTGWVSAVYLKKRGIGNREKHYEAGIWNVVANRSFSTQEAYRSGSLNGKRIVIDTGHCGVDRGAKGAFHSTLESELTLRTGLLAAEKLRAAGAIVMMTRMNNDYFSLANRVFQSESVFADAFISIHYNSSLSPDVSGLSTFYNKSGDQELAQSIQAEILNGGTNLKDRGAKFGDYYVIRENQRPAALIELGFLSNRQDELQAETQGFQENAVSGIVNGLENYFNQR